MMIVLYEKKKKKKKATFVDLIVVIKIFTSYGELNLNGFHIKQTRIRIKTDRQGNWCG